MQALPKSRDAGTEGAKAAQIEDTESQGNEIWFVTIW